MRDQGPVLTEVYDYSEKLTWLKRAGYIYDGRFYFNGKRHLSLDLERHGCAAWERGTGYVIREVTKDPQNIYNTLGRDEL